MTVLLHLVFLAIGVAILVKSADWFTGAAVEVARRMRIPEIIVGATLVSLATTLPEFAVSFLATWQGKASLAVGNAVGSTICNVGFILGLCAFLSPMVIEQREFVRNGAGLLALVSVFGVLGFAFPEGSRWVGLVMLSCLIAYLGSIVRSATRQRRGVHATTPSTYSIPMTVVLFVVGAAGVVGGSRLMVWSAVHLATRLGVPELVIGLSIVAVGTSTPELVVSIAAILKKQRGLSIGNIIGANILNLAWVIGACSLVSPLPLSDQTRWFDVPVTFLLSILMLIFGATGKQLVRWEGAVLLCIYAAYVTLIFAVFSTAPIS